jgi:outer membrane protein OmpU
MPAYDGGIRMRKLLLAGVACVAAWSMSGAANAATVYESATTGVPGAAPVTTPKPGELVVNIDLRINTYVQGTWNSFAGGGAAPNNVNGVGSKASPLGIAGYARAYLGVSGKTTSGINYGLFWEIRQDFTANTGSATDLSSGVSGESGTGTPFWRRNYAYIGTDTLGTVRLGQTDSSDLYLVGVFDDYGTGGWNGDLPLNGSGGPIWPWMDIGNYYTSAKIVYLSPSLAGFDFGIGYEPNAATMTDGLFNENLVSTSDMASDLAKRRNTIDGALRYKGAFGPVGIAASGILMYGGHVLAGPINPGINGVTNFDNFELKDVGLALTTFGLTVGGNYLWGQWNGAGAAKPDGQPNAYAWIGGAEYAIGPLLVGAAYYQFQYAGTVGAVTARRDSGVQIGANYNIAPGLQVIAEYLWGNSRQNAVNAAGTEPSSVPGSRYYYQEQDVGIGLQLRW